MSEFYKNPPEYDELEAKIAALQSAAGANMRAFTVGRSVLGRNIRALGFGRLRGSTLFVGGVHGNEWLTTLLLIKFCDDLIKSIAQNSRIADIDIKKTVEEHGLIIVPCLNPDGTEIAVKGPSGAMLLAESVEKMCGSNYTEWKANARGVDINHNFNAGWEKIREYEKGLGINEPAPAKFGGARHTSEPETRAIMNLCVNYDVQKAYAFHSQGEEIYYLYADKTPVRSALMAQLLAASSGYRAITEQGPATCGGFKDWFVDKMGRPAFTIEIGRGKNPLPIDDLEHIYAQIFEMLVLALVL